MNFNSVLFFDGDGFRLVAGAPNGLLQNGFFDGLLCVDAHEFAGEVDLAMQPGCSLNAFSMRMAQFCSACLDVHAVNVVVVVHVCILRLDVLHFIAATATAAVLQFLR